MEPQVRYGLVNRGVLYGEGHMTSFGMAPQTHRFPVAQCARVPHPHGRGARASNGLQVPQFHNSGYMRGMLLGESQPFTHPDAIDDTGSPQHHLFDEFLECFVWDLYH